MMHVPEDMAAARRAEKESSARRAEKDNVARRAEAGDAPSMADRQDEKAARQNQMPLFKLLGIMLLVAAAMVLLNLSGGAENPEDLPYVEAQGLPYKKQPENPGGAETPYTNRQIYALLEDKPEGSKKNQREILLPMPEEPLPAEEMPTQNLPTQPVAGSALPQERPALESSAAIEPSAAVAAPADKPRLKEKQAETVSELIAELQAASPQQQEKNESKSSAKDEKQSSEASPRYRLQLASLADKATAEAEAKRLQRRHRDALGKIKLKVSRAEIGERKLWRVQSASDLPEDKAGEICSAIRAEKTGCLAVRVAAVKP